MKTRLAQSVGAAQAIKFYELSLNCLSYTLQSLPNDINVTIFLDENTQEAFDWAFKKWPHYIVLAQKQHDNLGQRIHNASEQLRNKNYSSICIIGSDSPDLPVKYITQSFESLKTKDVVLNGCRDGGFYLMGSRVTLPDINKLSWSSSKLFHETKHYLRRHSLSVQSLDNWYDIDYKEDLRVLLCNIKNSKIRPFIELKKWIQNNLTLSFIIPSHKENNHLKRIVTSLLKLETKIQFDIIIVHTKLQNKIPLDPDPRIKLVHSKKANRAFQLNLGVNHSASDLLCFLHADSILNLKAYNDMLHHLIHKDYAGGCFSFSIHKNQKEWPLKLYEKLVNFRSQNLNMPYGDQGYFVKREIFDAIGPFKNYSLLEDLEWYDRLSKAYKTIQLNSTLETSPRCAEQNGWLKSTAINIAAASFYKIGIEQNYIAKWHKKQIKVDRSL